MSKMFEIVVMIKKTTHPNATHILTKYNFQVTFCIILKKRIKNVTDSHESSIKMRFYTKRIGCIIPYTMLNATFCKIHYINHKQRNLPLLHVRLLTSTWIYSYNITSPINNHQMRIELRGNRFFFLSFFSFRTKKKKI